MLTKTDIGKRVIVRHSYPLHTKSIWVNCTEFRLSGYYWSKGGYYMAVLKNDDDSLEFEMPQKDVRVIDEY